MIVVVRAEVVVVTVEVIASGEIVGGRGGGRGILRGRNRDRGSTADIARAAEKVTRVICECM